MLIGHEAGGHASGDVSLGASNSISMNSESLSLSM